MNNEPTEKPSIYSKPVFWVAMGLIVFNILLFIWSVNRDTREAEKAEIDKLEQQLP
jgi:hypothetical protein